MLPLRDNISKQKVSFVNYLLIAANVRVFFYELSLGPRLEHFILRYGLQPSAWAHVSLAPQGSWQDAFFPLISSMFLHGGWMHIVSNMWVLFIFGRSVEDRLGHFRYLFLYMTGGIAAGLFQLWTHWGSDMPTIGASGAIAGVMGAYFVLFPFARIMTIVPIFFLPQIVEIPALFFLGMWFLTQIFSGVYSLGANFGGIAWWAHIGGFLAGMYLVRRLR